MQFWSATWNWTQTAWNCLKLPETIHTERIKNPAIWLDHGRKTNSGFIFNLINKGYNTLRKSETIARDNRLLHFPIQLFHEFGHNFWSSRHTEKADPILETWNSGELRSSERTAFFTIANHAALFSLFCQCSSLLWVRQCLSVFATVWWLEERHRLCT